MGGGDYMKANKLRYLAGGLAIILMMSTLNPAVAYAAEDGDAVAMVEEISPAEETEPESEETGQTEEVEPEAEETEQTEEVEPEAEETEQAEEVEPVSEETGQTEEVESVSEETEQTEKVSEEAELVVEDTELAAVEPETAETEVAETEQATEESNQEIVEATQPETTSVEEVASETDPQDDDIILTSTPQSATVSMEEIEAEAEANVKARLENMTMDELLNLCLGLSTATTNDYISEDAENTDVAHVMLVKEAEDKYTQKLLKSYFDNGLEALIASLPNGKLYGKPIQNVIYTILGYNNNNVDLKDVINSTHSETMDKLDEVCKKNKDTSVVASTLCEYGGRFDKFEVEAQGRAQAIADIKKNPTLSENEKAVQIAAVIGGAKDWNAGNTAIFEKMNYAAQTLNGKPATDPQGRNIFEVIYDYYKDESAFSGEAMDKSEGYIQERLNGFIRNCGVAIECLKAHQQISKFSEEDIASMSAENQKLYADVKTSNYDIGCKLKNIINIFTGDKQAEKVENQTGVLDKAGEYYSHNRNNYLRQEKGTIKEVAISKNPYVQKSEDFNLDDLKAHSALSRDEILNLQAHVNATGLTMEEYLNSMGIDTTQINVKHGPHGYRTAYLSTLDSKVSSTANSRGRGTTDWYLKGINMNEKGATEKNYKYAHKYVRTWIWEDNEYNSYNSAVSVVLQNEK